MVGFFESDISIKFTWFEGEYFSPFCLPPINNILSLSIITDDAVEPTPALIVVNICIWSVSSMFNYSGEYKSYEIIR